MSQSNSIKNLLNIEDVNIKNVVTKHISTILSKKNANCSHYSSKKNAFKIVKIKILKTFGYE